MKVRILLFFYFLGLALLAVFWPEPALEVATDHKAGEEKRRRMAAAFTGGRRP